MNVIENFGSYLNASIQTKQLIMKDSDTKKSIAKLAVSALETIKNNKKLIFCGNGGSFADSQHLAAEFVSRFEFDRHPLPALALGTNSSNMSAIGNDYGYEQVFARELSVIAEKGDLFIPISTSGQSKNILNAVGVAKQKEIKCIALTGDTGGALATQTECVRVPSNVTAHIQESHIMIGHFVCKFVEGNIF